MTFVDAFTGTNGTTLQAHDAANWTKQFGDDLTITSNALGRGASASGSMVGYFRTNDSSVDQIAVADISATFIGPMVMASVTGHAVFQATIDTTTLTVDSITSGSIVIGTTLSGAGVTTCIITSQLTGSAGSTGTYVISVSQTIAVAQAMLASNFNCYLLRRTSGTSVRVNKVLNGVLGATNYALNTVSNTLGIGLRATVSGSTVSFDVVQWDGTSYVSKGIGTGTGSDSSGTALLTGVRGIVHTATTVAGAPAIVTYQDNYSSIPFAVTSITDNEVREGIQVSGGHAISGTYTGSPTQLQVRLVNGSGTVITNFDWANVDSASAGSFSKALTNIPAGPTKLFAQVRDTADTGTVLTSTSGFYVGAVVIMQGQSQCDHLFNNDLGGLTPTVGMLAFAWRFVAQTGSGSKRDGTPPSPSLINIATTPATIGSGIIAAANQYWADVAGAYPICFIEHNYSGTSIVAWTSDSTATFGGVTSATTMWTGVGAAARSASKNQASVVLWCWGTADASNFHNNYTAYKTQMGTLQTMFGTALPTMNPLMVIMPHDRSNDVDDNFTWLIRNAQWEQATSGGNWRLGGWAMDITMDSEGSPHQSDGTLVAGLTVSAATGLQRHGTRVGRAVASALHGTNSSGPRISSAMFTDGTKAAFDITFDRNIERTDGGNTIGSTTFVPDQISISTNAGTTFPALAAYSYTVTMQAANKVRVARSSGSWTSGQTRIDFFRGVPFLSPNASPSFSPAISEATLETNYLSKLIADTTSFDGGRGMPPAPYMTTGINVTDYSSGSGSWKGLLLGRI